MEIKQRRFSNKTLFEFGDNKLKYTVEDKNGSTSFSIEYGEIPTDCHETKERDAWYQNVGIFLILIGITIMIDKYLTHGSVLGIVSGILWLMLGTICLSIYYFSETQYTVINTEKGKLFIIENKQHDEIIKEIYTRRKQQLLYWYGDVNYTNDPNNEVKKFRWLQQQGVITEAQFKEIFEKLKAYHLEDQYSLTDDSGKKIIN